MAKTREFTVEWVEHRVVTVEATTHEKARALVESGRVRGELRGVQLGASKENNLGGIP